MTITMFEPRTSSYDSRISFERNTLMLGERIHAGTIRFNESMRHSLKGLTEVRSLPNGRINLLTIDEAVRCMMHMMPEMENLSKEEQYEKDE